MSRIVPVEESFWDKVQEALQPVVYLSSNWLSQLGVVIVTTATVFWLFLLPTTLGGGEIEHPYFGILAFLVLPGVFLAGLLLIPAGIFLRKRMELRRGLFPAHFPPLDIHNLGLRRLLAFVVLTTLVNLVIASQLTYAAVTYMDSVSFCGQACHSVMQPEFAAYQNSPHSRVECVKCHIGAGASWFVRSKLSGVRQVFAVTFNTHSRPIPTPVQNLRPARETCEACHWPQKYGGDKLRVVSKFADDEGNTQSKTVLLMKIGGGSGVIGPGIHGVHVSEGVTIRYAHADEQRQNIPWVEYRDRMGNVRTYTSADAKPDAIKNLPGRTMDCMDCHNRPSHSFELPESAVDRALAAGDISPVLPFAKKKSVELLRASYNGRGEGAARIPAEFEKYYRTSHAEAYQQRQAEVARSAKAVLAIYNRNVFPDMKIAWGTYPNNIGHNDFPGCFRCHDDKHATAEGKTISQDCNSCHSLLAMEEPAPKILGDLGVSAGTAPAK